MNKVLEVKSVAKKIGKRTILDDVSLDVNEGEIFGFVGPNGAGKTTLIKVMLGLYKLDKGSVAIAEFDIKKDFEKALNNVGAIIENPELYDYLSGKENLKLFANMRNNITIQVQEELIRLVKLESRINHKVKTYSLGMKQRLGIAQALLSEPKLLILDEPTNGLDPLGMKELRDMLKKIAKEKNMAIFISSHILSEIELMCDKVAIIDNGKIIEVKDSHESDEDEVLKVTIEVDNPELAYEKLKQTGAEITRDNNKLTILLIREQIPQMNEYLVRNKIKVYEIKTDKKRLEDEFIEITTGTKGQIV